MIGIIKALQYSTVVVTSGWLEAFNGLRKAVFDRDHSVSRLQIGNVSEQTQEQEHNLLW